MPAPRKYTDEQRAEALALYETEGPSAVAKKLGIPKNTVVRWAKDTGTHTVRNERTREAVQAKVLDGKLRRQNLTHRLYAQAEKILDDLEGETFRTLIKGTQGRDKDVTLDFVPPNDRRTLVQTVATTMTTTAKLEAIDSGDDTSETDSVLDRLVSTFEQIHKAGPGE